jgi:DNA-binding NarL/FixJ family response regulator
MEFFQYVRAGIKGYLPREASAEDVLEAMHAVPAGQAVCPGALCALLFRFFEREASSVHSATLHPRLGLTRGEQQIVPLIAQGLTNKERMLRPLGAGVVKGFATACIPYL